LSTDLYAFQLKYPKTNPANLTPFSNKTNKKIQKNPQKLFAAIFMSAEKKLGR
jgi:hypothetical protein